MAEVVEDSDSGMGTPAVVSFGGTRRVPADAAGALQKTKKK